MGRPSPWQLNDAYSFGLVALLMTAGALAITLWGEAESLASAIALGWVVAAVGWAFYGWLVYSRWRYIQRFDVALSHGIMVARNGYLASSLELEDELQRFIQLYAPHVRNVVDVLEEKRIWVVFHPGAIRNVGGYEKVAGFVVVGGNVAHVAYFRRQDGIVQEDPAAEARRTAFAHELGHIVLGRSWGNWDQGKHHDFQRFHKIP